MTPKEKAEFLVEAFEYNNTSDAERRAVEFAKQHVVWLMEYIKEDEVIDYYLEVIEEINKYRDI
jgi:hypothetical protein